MIYNEGEDDRDITLLSIIRDFEDQSQLAIIAQIASIMPRHSHVRG